jgi:hypothetical protein
MFSVREPFPEQLCSVENHDSHTDAHFTQLAQHKFRRNMARVPVTRRMLLDVLVPENRIWPNLVRHCAGAMFGSGRP